jgi:hypothetical protein
MSKAKKLFASMLVVVFGFVGLGRMGSSMAEAPPSLKHPAAATPIDRISLVATLRDGYTVFTGQPPTQNMLAMGWAQVSFENGQGARVYNHNFGNIGPNHADQPYFCNPFDGSPYRHFDTFLEGAVEYWRVIKHCEAAWQRFGAGLPGEAAKYLRRCGYYELDEATYAGALSSLYYEAIRKVLPDERARQADAGATPAPDASSSDHR